MSFVPVDVLKVPESVLRTPCAAAPPEEALEIIRLLEEAMRRTKDCAGLAAPQIGIGKQVSIIRFEGLALNLVNPTIVRAEQPFTYHREGCMSFPRRRFDVPRFGLVEVEYDAPWGHDGDRRKMGDPDVPSGAKPRFVRRRSVHIYDLDKDRDESLVAVAVQHEIDHLNGVCLPFKEGAKEVEPVPPDILEIPDGPKAGRNDPCPCGSGKKFKRCCLR